MITTSAQASWALILVCFIWGVMFVLVDRTIELIPVHSFHTMRFGVAALCLLTIWLLDGQQRKIVISKQLVLTSMLLAFVLFVSFASQTLGLKYTSVANTAFITSLSVTLVPILCWLLLGQRIKRLVWLGIVLATLGIYLLTGADGLIFNSGDILALICAVGFATHIVLTAKVSANYSVLPLCTIQLAAVSLYSGIAALLFEPVSSELLAMLREPIVITTVVVAGMFATAFAYVVQTSVQRLLPAHKVGMMFTSEPIFAYFSAALFLGERLGLEGLGGALLIVVGVLVVEFADRDHPPKIQLVDYSIAPDAEEDVCR